MCLKNSQLLSIQIQIIHRFLSPTSNVRLPHWVSHVLMTFCIFHFVSLTSLRRFSINLSSSLLIVTSAVCNVISDSFNEFLMLISYFLNYKMSI